MKSHYSKSGDTLKILLYITNSPQPDRPSQKPLTGPRALVHYRQKFTVRVFFIRSSSVHQYNANKCTHKCYCTKQSPVWSGHCIKQPPVYSGHCIKQPPVYSGHCIKQPPVYSGHFIKQPPVYSGHCIKQPLVYSGHCTKQPPVYSGHCMK